nr:MAG TPA: SecA, SecY, SecE, AYC08, SecA, ATPase, channel, PROTEIN [Caudoviricetes sp.]
MALIDIQQVKKEARRVVFPSGLFFYLFILSWIDLA